MLMQSSVTKTFDISKLTPTTHFNFRQFLGHVQSPAVAQLFFLDWQFLLPALMEVSASHHDTQVWIWLRWTIKIEKSCKLNYGVMSCCSGFNSTLMIWAVTVATNFSFDWQLRLFILERCCVGTKCRPSALLFQKYFEASDASNSSAS